MRGIILAAGKSIRMGNLTSSIPKCLLDINGMTTLGRQIEALKSKGINFIEIVVGFKNEKIVEYCTRNYPDVDFLIHINKKYDTTNNGYSLSLALQSNTSPFILLNADTIFHPDLITQVINSKHADLVTVKYKNEIIDEDMKVEVATDGTICAISKDNNIVKDKSRSYEFTGVAKFSIRETIEKLDYQLNKKEHSNSWFEVSLSKILKNSKIYSEQTTYPTLEIDFPKDLEEARDLFIENAPDWEIGIRHYSLTQGKRNLDDAYNLLCDMVDVLEEHNIEYWLNWGCLLGIYRDGNFIKWDTDIDVTIHKKDEVIIKDKVIDIMRESGCFVVAPDKCCEGDFWFIRDKEKIELNSVHDIGDNYVYSPGRCDLTCQKEYIDNLDEIFFRGRTFKIPSNTSQYLKLSYGDDWETPIKGNKPKSIVRV